MNTRQTATQIARRLPDLRKRDVQEVLDLLTELWREELAKPNGEIHISGLGTLYVETHTCGPPESCAGCSCRSTVG